MCDLPYEPGNVDHELIPVFEQLKAAFGADYPIYRRVEDFGRRKSAGIVNTADNTAVIIPLKSGLRTVRTHVTSEDIDKVRRHLTSQAGSDWTLEPV